MPFCNKRALVITVLWDVDPRRYADNGKNNDRKRDAPSKETNGANAQSLASHQG